MTAHQHTVGLGSMVEDGGGQPIGSVILSTHGHFGNLTPEQARAIGTGLITAAAQADIDAQWVTVLRVLSAPEDLIQAAGAAVVAMRADEAAQR